MEYQGNPSLPKETRERILTTFQQTLDSARQGSLQEAMLGCDFIQRLDPQFQPARILAERLKQGGNIETADLVPGAPAAAAPTAPTPTTPTPAAPAPAAASVDPERLRAALRKLEADGDFDKLIQLARKYQSTVMQHQDMQELVQGVQMRQQTALYVENFLKTAAEGLDRGDLDAVVENLNKAKGLDPDNPQVAQLQKAHAQAVAAQLAAQGAAQSAEQAQASAPELEASSGFDLDSLDFSSLDTGSLDTASPEQPDAEPVPEPLATVKMQSPAAASGSTSGEAAEGEGFDFSMSDLGEPSGFELPDAAPADPPAPATPLAAAPLATSPPAALDDTTESATDLGFELGEAPAPAPIEPAPAAPDSGFDIGGGFDLGTSDEDTGFGGFDLGTSSDDGGFELPPAEPAPQATMELGDPPAPALDDTPEDTLEDDSLELPPDLSVDAAEPALAPEPEAATPPAPVGDPIPPSGDSRIDDLLREGQGAFEQRDYQGAIDAWSRIFLIDLDNEEASRRIDKARQLKAESERHVEEVFQEGVEALKAKDAETAKRSFQTVLEAQPGNTEARDYLEQLEAGQMPDLGDEGRTTDTIEAAAEHMLAKQIMVPPEPGEEAAPRGPAEKRQVAIGGASARRRFLIIGGLVLLLVIGGGWYLFTHRDDFFPNTADPGAGTETPGQRLSPIDRARAQYERGNAEAALNALKKLPPNSPHYEEAQALIAEWDVAGQPVDPLDQEIDPAVQARHDALVAAAREEFGAGQMLRARALFRAAGETLPLSPEDSQRLFDTEEKARSLSEEIALFEKSEWEEALRVLWRRPIAEHQDPDVKLLIAYCYYNIGVQGLQRDNLNSAEQNFTELLEVDPDDADARRHLLFAKTYLQRDEDLLYRIYVKYLPFRSVP